MSGKRMAMPLDSSGGKPSQRPAALATTTEQPLVVASLDRLVSQNDRTQPNFQSSFSNLPSPVSEVNRMLALNIVNVAATITTVVLLFSPSPDYRRIHTEKNTGEVRILPVLMLGINCFMWSVYGFLRGTIFPVMSLNAFGAFTCSVFSMVFYRWSSDRAALRKMAVATVAWVVLVIAFVVLCRTNVLSTSSNLQEKIIGYLAVAFNICLYAAPLQTMTLVLRTKSAASLPVMMCSVNLVNGSLWVLYGILANDMFVLTPNALGVALSVIQVALCIKYRPTGPALNVGTKGDVSVTMSPVVEDEVAITFVKSPVYESVHSPV